MLRIVSQNHISKNLLVKRLYQLKDFWNNGAFFGLKKGNNFVGLTIIHNITKIYNLFINILSINVHFFQ